MKTWHVESDKRYHAAEGSRAGWHQTVEKDKDGKETGNSISVTAPTPEMAHEAIEVLSKHFNAKT